MILVTSYDIFRNLAGPPKILQYRLHYFGCEKERKARFCFPRFLTVYPAES